MYFSFEFSYPYYEIFLKLLKKILMKKKLTKWELKLDFKEGLSTLCLYSKSREQNFFFSCGKEKDYAIAHRGSWKLTHTTLLYFWRAIETLPIFY